MIGGVGLGDAQRIMQATGSPSPIALGARLAGFGDLRGSGGVPGWAWFLAGMVAGGALVWRYGDEARDRLAKLGLAKR